VRPWLRPVHQRPDATNLPPLTGDSMNDGCTPNEAESLDDRAEPSLGPISN